MTKSDPREWRSFSIQPSTVPRPTSRLTLDLEGSHFAFGLAERAVRKRAESGWEGMRRWMRTRRRQQGWKVTASSWYVNATHER